MQWDNLRRYLRAKYVDKGGDCLIDCKYLKLKYRGGGDFFYSYHYKNFIRTGVFSLKLPAWTKPLTRKQRKFSFFIPKFHLPRHSAMLGVACMLLFISVYYTFRSPDFMEELKEIDAIGGFGEIHSGDVSSQKALKNDKHSEIDERAKNSLLGISNTTTSAFSDKKPQKTDKLAYKVQPGDTLSGISKKFNISVESIAGSSGISSPDSISVGQTLKIPPKNGFYYKVKKNDRLGVILSKYKLDLDKILAENLHINPDLLESGEEIFLLGAKPKNLIYGWLIPVTSRIITSGYGWRNWPRKAFHKGLDLKAYYTRVRAAKSGKVHYAGRLGGYGKVVVLHHSGGYRTLYAHLSRIYVRSGSRVVQGGAIGKSGNTGYSFGPHLHFEVSKYGNNINPKKILRGLKKRRRRR